MKQVRYFIEFLFIKLFFLIFKLIGYKNASSLGAKIGSILGPIFRSRKNNKIILRTVSQILQIKR